MPLDRCRCISKWGRKYDSLRERTAASLSSSHFIIIVSHPFIMPMIINIIIYVIKVGRASVVARERRSCRMLMEIGKRVCPQSIYNHCLHFFEAYWFAWMRSRFPRDGFSDRLDIVLKRRKWRRGTNPRALDLLLEIKECIKKETVAGWQTGWECCNEVRELGWRIGFGNV